MYCHTYTVNIPLLQNIFCLIIIQNQLTVTVNNIIERSSRGVSGNAMRGD